MLKLILDPLSGAVKKLPGFPLGLSLITILYLRAFGAVEAKWQEAVVLIATWYGYRWGGYLDKPLYDSVFGPRRKRRSGLRQWQERLDDLRDRVTVRVFRDVSGYADAVRKGTITESGPGTLYNRCVSPPRPHLPPPTPPRLP